MIQAPRLFAGQIKLGDVTQSSSAFGKCTISLSFFRNAYDSFAGYRATIIRLTVWSTPTNRPGSYRL